MVILFSARLYLLAEYGLYSTRNKITLDKICTHCKLGTESSW